METLIIDRQKWGRGDFIPKGSSRLYNSTTEKMCCLGFECVSRGITQDEIAGTTMPSNLFRFTRDTLIGLLTESAYDSYFSKQASVINDALIGETVYLDFSDVELKSEEQREQLLKDLFWEHLNKIVEFIN